MDQQAVPIHAFGEFRIGKRSLFGELKIDGPDSNLRLHSHDYIAFKDVADRFVSGELSDRRRVSLLVCNVPHAPNSRSTETEQTYFADIFPHYVVLGNEHVQPTGAAISAIHWTVPDISALFYDFDAFAPILEPTRFIGAIIAEQEREIGRKIPVGPHPVLQYFTGRYDIFSCDIGFGSFSARHRWQQNFGGPAGIWMKNRIQAEIRFHAPVEFETALAHAYEVSTFLGFAAGRPQDVDDISLKLAGSEEYQRLQVFVSLPLRYEPAEGRFNVGPADVLLDGVDRSDEFGAVLSHWLGTHAEMVTPRSRLWDSFKKQNHYDADRIIAAANLFDTIPDKHFPKRVDLPDDILKTAAEAKALFKPLPQSPERDSMLGELSRLSRPRLRTRIKHWAADLIQHHGDDYPDLEFVIEQAVKCRNFFVHGGNAEFDYHAEVHLFAFLTRALEFCYVIPEFLRGGWDLVEWLRKNGSRHPFGEFTVSYVSEVKRLRATVAAAREEGNPT